jgi:GNAT superfamily N-acetyltransferase
MQISAYDRERDSIEELTALLHRAYRVLAEMGLNYVASTQEVETTAARIELATACWVVRAGADLVGTACYYGLPYADAGPEWYRRSDVGFFGQFAVEPAMQGSGIGSALLDNVERRARADGKAELACDTAAGAAHLIEFYRRRNFRQVGCHRWPHATYESYVLSKRLRAAENQ